MKDSGKSLFAGLAVQQFSKRMKFSYALEPCMAIGKQYNIRDPFNFVYTWMCIVIMY